MQNENLNMYHLGYKPERLDDFNEYFIKYIETKKQQIFQRISAFL